MTLSQLMNMLDGAFRGFIIFVQNSVNILFLGRFYLTIDHVSLSPYTTKGFI